MNSLGSVPNSAGARTAAGSWRAPPDGRLYARGHPEAFHVDGLCLGCANIAAVEPGCGTVTGPPTWQIAHRFQDDGTAH